VSRSVSAIAIAFLFFVSCRHESSKGSAGAVHTTTISPAAAQPAPTGNDAVTQTVDIEDSRSEE
jgi:hypothetical protein